MNDKLDLNLLCNDSLYRLNNLYCIIDKNGNSVRFKLNAIQYDFLSNIHNRNLILKARQLGMSTCAVLYLLDQAIWTKNLSCGIVSYSLEHAQHIFKKIIGHALDNLPPWLTVPILNRSAREIYFENGSVLRVDTTLRGGSYQKILVSEFGKTCARNPLKAEEVITGTLQTVSENGTIIIESTGEGSDGFFADMIFNASLRGNENLSALDYKLFFYPWFTDASYQLEQNIELDTYWTDHFKEIESINKITLSKQQKNWYITQSYVLGDKVRQEYPSTIKEAFLSSSDAYYFAEAIEKAYKEGRCVYVNIYDALFPLYVSMDIGVNDLTVIIFFQIVHGEIRVIDYYEDKNKDVDFYAHFLLQDKRFLYHTIFLPHDSKKRSPIKIEESFERDLRRLFQGTSTKIHVLERQEKQIQISHARIKISRCVFNLNKVKKLVDQLSKYRKTWNEALGKYTEVPYHNIASNYADAFIYMSQGVSHLESVQGLGVSGAYEKHRKVVENRNKRLI